MKNTNYHLFLFLTTFTRGIVEAFSLVLLYKKGFSVDNLLLFLCIMYGVGILVNYVSLRVNYKIVLVISSLLYGVGYLYLSFMKVNLINLVIFSLLLSFGTYSYHCIRHYLALFFMMKNTSLMVNVMFLGLIVASVVGTYFISKLSIFWISIILFSLSILSLVPIFKVELKEDGKKKKILIEKRKILFNIFEQFKVIFLELQPLFLYLYINDSIIFVGGFNIIINISALIVLFFMRKINVIKYYFFVCLGMGIVLLFKISLSNTIILFLVAVIEGIVVKLYERGSLSYLYDIKNNSIREYLNIEEFVFFVSKFIIMFIFLLLKLNLKSILFICIIGIIVSGFMYDENNKCI